MFLHSKLDFKEHIQNVLISVSKTIGLLRKLPKSFSRPPLTTIYNFFYKTSSRLWGHFFHQILESIQYNAAVWYRKLCCFYKVFKIQSYCYLFDVIPTAKKTYITRNNDKLPHFKVKCNYLKNSFFPSI